MCMKKMPGENKEVKDFDEDVEEMMDINESVQMMNIINNILQALGKDQINVLDWAKLCPNEEELVFEYFFTEDVSSDVAVAALRALLEAAFVEEHSC